MSQADPLALTAADRGLRQRDFLLRAAQAISAPLDLREVLARVIQTAVTMTAGQAGAIALRQPGDEMRIAASYHLDARFESHLEREIQGEGSPYASDGLGPSSDRSEAAAEPASSIDLPPSRVLDRSQTADREDSKSRTAPPGSGPGIAPPAPAPLARIQDGPHYAEEVRARIQVRAIESDAGAPDGARQVLTLPLELAGATIGRIFVFRSDGAAAFTPLDSELLGSFAEQAAVAIHNADTHMRLAARERRLSSILDHSPAGVLLLDPEAQVVSHNPAAASLLGRPGDDLVGEDARELLSLVDSQDGRWDFRLPPRAEALTRQGRVKRPDGRSGPWLQATVTPLPEPRSETAGWLLDLVDLSGFKEAEDAKRAFLAGLSHELKTPLSLIRGYAETLRHEQVRQDIALHAESVEVILDETQHLTDMVDQLLTAARLEAGALRLDLHTVNVGAELERLVQSFRTARPAHRWSLEASQDLPTIQADPQRLREVFANLLGNAAKYAPDGSPVRIAATVEGEGLRVEVQDEGIGIAPEDRDRVFDRFFRAAERGEGAGLGLYMARAIVQAHGGRIDLASQPGLGSTFSVWLPARGPERT
jgi:PAS domain S-box-containing protein